MALESLVNELEQELQRRTADALRLYHGLTPAEERALQPYQQNGAMLGTFAELFELSLRGWSVERSRTVSAILADYMRTDALKMVVMRRTADARAVKHLCPHLRFFALDYNQPQHVTSGQVMSSS